MIKLVCLDYAGAILQLKGNELKRMFTVLAENSRLKSEEEAAEWIHTTWDALEHQNTGENAVSEMELFEKMMNKADIEIQMRCDHNLMRTLFSDYRMYGPIGNDVKEFIEHCPLPVYITAMNDATYVNVCLRRNGLHVNGIVSAERTPLKYSTASLLQEAQNMFGCSPDEIMYVGRHPKRDIIAASDFGASAVLLDRRSKYRGSDCRRVRSLIELLPQLIKETEAVQ